MPLHQSPCYQQVSEPYVFPYQRALGRIVYASAGVPPTWGNSGEMRYQVPAKRPTGLTSRALGDWAEFSAAMARGQRFTVQVKDL